MFAKPDPIVQVVDYDDVMSTANLLDDAKFNSLISTDHAIFESYHRFTLKILRKKLLAKSYDDIGDFLQELEGYRRSMFMPKSVHVWVDSSPSANMLNTRYTFSAENETSQCIAKTYNRNIDLYPDIAIVQKSQPGLTTDWSTVFNMISASMIQNNLTQIMKGMDADNFKRVREKLDVNDDIVHWILTRFCDTIINGGYQLTILKSQLARLSTYTNPWAWNVQIQDEYKRMYLVLMLFLPRSKEFGLPFVNFYAKAHIDTVNFDDMTSFACEVWREDHFAIDPRNSDIDLFFPLSSQFIRRAKQRYKLETFIKKKQINHCRVIEIEENKEIPDTKEIIIPYPSLLKRHLDMLPHIGFAGLGIIHKTQGNGMKNELRRASNAARKLYALQIILTFLDVCDQLGGVNVPYGAHCLDYYEIAQSSDKNLIRYTLPESKYQITANWSIVSKISIIACKCSVIPAAMVLDKFMSSLRECELIDEKDRDRVKSVFDLETIAFEMANGKKYTVTRKGFLSNRRITQYTRTRSIFPMACYMLSIMLGEFWNNVGKYIANMFPPWLTRFFTQLYDGVEASYTWDDIFNGVDTHMNKWERENKNVDFAMNSILRIISENMNLVENVRNSLLTPGDPWYSLTKDPLSCAFDVDLFRKKHVIRTINNLADLHKESPFVRAKDWCVLYFSDNVRSDLKVNDEIKEKILTTDYVPIYSNDPDELNRTLHLLIIGQKSQQSNNGFFFIQKDRYSTHCIMDGNVYDDLLNVNNTLNRMNDNFYIHYALYKND
jgi:hypothetical protein